MEGKFDKNVDFGKLKLTSHAFSFCRKKKSNPIKTTPTCLYSHIALTKRASL